MTFPPSPALAEGIDWVSRPITWALALSLCGKEACAFCRGGEMSIVSGSFEHLNRFLKNMCELVFETLLCSCSLFGFHRAAKDHTSDISKAQRSSPQPEAGCAPELKLQIFCMWAIPAHFLVISTYSQAHPSTKYWFLKMPGLFLLNKQNKRQEPENNDTPSGVHLAQYSLSSGTPYVSKGE